MARSLVTFDQEPCRAAYGKARAARGRACTTNEMAHRRQSLQVLDRLLNER
jgi:hypothetical protein